MCGHPALLKSLDGTLIVDELSSAWSRRGVTKLSTKPRNTQARANLKTVPQKEGPAGRGFEVLLFQVFS